MSNPAKKLVVFDVDGVLVDRDGTRLLPGVARWFATHAHRYHVALATNQGGVGLRYWMTANGFGDPDKYPRESDVETRLTAINGSLPGGPYPVFCSFAYQSKKGQWAPVPPERTHDPRWQPSWRKPNAGMLFAALDHYGMPCDRAMYIGDRQEDRQAAQNAGIEFHPVRGFFTGPDEDRAAAIGWARGMLDDGNFIVFDTETTGTGYQDQVLEVGAVDTNGQVLIDELFNPTCAIHPDATAVHGFTAHDLRLMPRFVDYYSRLVDIFNGREAVAYNTPFDRRMLDQTCRACNKPLIVPASWHDAMINYSEYALTPSDDYGRYQWHKLEEVAAAKGWQYDGAAHGALADAKMTLRLIRWLAEQ